MVEGQLIKVQAIQKDTSIRSVLGAAKKFGKWSTGLSYIIDFDHEKFFLYGDIDTPTLTLNNRGQFSRFGLGIRFDASPKTTFAMSYFSEMDKDYSGVQN